MTAMAVVAIVAMVPITPGAIGITEVAYIGILSAVTRPGAADQITAAVMLFRIAQWLAPIPIGWALLLVMRRGHWGDLLSPGDPGTPAAVDEAAVVPCRPVNPKGGRYGRRSRRPDAGRTRRQEVHR